MSWSAPPTFVSGTVFTAGNANILSSDLTVLETFVGFLGIDGSLGGTASPTPGSPNISFVGGIAGATATAGNFSFAYKVAFPTDVLFLLMQPTILGDNNITVSSGSTNAIGAGQYYAAGSPAGGAISFVYFAAGF